MRMTNHHCQLKKFQHQVLSMVKDITDYHYEMKNILNSQDTRIPTDPSQKYNFLLLTSSLIFQKTTFHKLLPEQSFQWKNLLILENLLIRICFSKRIMTNHHHELKKLQH